MGVCGIIVESGFRGVGGWCAQRVWLCLAEGAPLFYDPEDSINPKVRVLD